MDVEVNEVISIAVSEPVEVTNTVAELHASDLAFVGGGMRPIGLITIDK